MNTSGAPFNAEDIEVGWVLFLSQRSYRKGQPLRCQRAGSGCADNCSLSKGGYNHPITVVGVRTLPDQDIEISFVQVWTLSKISLNPLLIMIDRCQPRPRRTTTIPQSILCREPKNMCRDSAGQIKEAQTFGSIWFGIRITAAIHISMCHIYTQSTCIPEVPCCPEAEEFFPGPTGVKCIHWQLRRESGYVWRTAFWRSWRKSLVWQVTKSGTLRSRRRFRKRVVKEFPLLYRIESWLTMLSFRVFQLCWVIQEPYIYPLVRRAHLITYAL
jgi:hypothetical protein